MNTLTILLQWGPHRGPYGPMAPSGGTGAGAMPWAGAGGTGVGLVPWLVVALFLVALLVGAVYLASRLRESGQGDDTTDALAVLRRRYARGEIADDEFDRRRTRLDGGPSS